MRIHCIHNIMLHTYIETYTDANNSGLVNIIIIIKMQTLNTVLARIVLRIGYKL